MWGVKSKMNRCRGMRPQTLRSAQESVIKILIGLSIYTSKGSLITLFPLPFGSTVTSGISRGNYYGARAPYLRRTRTAYAISRLALYARLASECEGRAESPETSFISLHSDPGARLPHDAEVFIFASRTVGASQRGKAAILELHTHWDHEFAFREGSLFDLPN
ncbi:hypothetical protein DFH09DRAFT_1076698 [Mycena vulgaris]|nr:hypothetical protein DFH09DRAFT_1076698 [Mycena vulgaris]